jgi:signal transduction histidine kinase
MKSDTPRLSQVFSNLINNSIDFIPENKGIIEINAQNKKDKVLFSVKDNGMGMTLETQKSLFQKFYQADTSIRRKHGGSGLGLAICKGIVEGLGGKIWLESEVGKGTTFFFTIPRGTLDENIDNR